MIKWPWKLLTNAGEAGILLRLALERAPDLRADGLTGEGELPDLRLIAACNDFLLPVRLKDTVDDRHTAATRCAQLEDWIESRELALPGLHGAFIAACLGRRASFSRTGISCHLNLRSRDFAERLVSVLRQVRR